jgi:FMN phosphatase YigB (HAD superfamily)
MPITLLLDLDDTLLNTNMDVFAPAYFQALSEALADLVPPEVMLPALMEGTKAMLANLDPAKTLLEVFYAHFFPKFNVDRTILQERINQFYDEEFPKLGSLTTPIPEAVRLVEWAFEQGHRVVIATNPIFPLKAIEHRLRWADLPPEEYPFALVTSGENMHFVKETVAYYPEVLAQLGWPQDPAVMVGDDIKREVKPTQAAGFPVYYVQTTDDIPAEAAVVPHGPLEAFKGWLEKADPNALKVLFDSSRALLATLRSTPAALATLMSSLPSQTWTRPPAPGEWCLTEIICHLRDVEREVNLPRIRKVLGAQNPFLVGEVTDVWAKERQYAHQDGRQALTDFTAARKENLRLLDDLGAEWTRPARHAIFGPTTLQELVGFTAGHDRAHVQQVWKTMRA